MLRSIVLALLGALGILAGLFLVALSPGLPPVAGVAVWVAVCLAAGPVAITGALLGNQRWGRQASFAWAAGAATGIASDLLARLFDEGDETHWLLIAIAAVIWWHLSFSIGSLAGAVGLEAVVYIRDDEG